MRNRDFPTVAEQHARLEALSAIEQHRNLTPEEAAEQRRLDELRIRRKALERCLLPRQIRATREKLARLEARAREIRL